MEFVSFDWIKILMELLSQDVHIKAVFVKDFVFFFNLAYAEFRLSVNKFIKSQTLTEI